MRIKFADIHSQVLSNAYVRFAYNKINKVYRSDATGLLELSNLRIGTKVTCQLKPGDEHKFVFGQEKEIVVNFYPPENEMVFIVVDQEMIPKANVKIFFEFSGQTLEEKSSSLGYVVLKEVPFNTNVKAYQIIDGEIRNSTLFTFIQEVPNYSVKIDVPSEKTSMKIKLVDKSGQAIRNSEVRIKIENREFDTISGQDGYIELDDIEPGSVIECRQISGNKIYPWHKLIFDQGVDEYIMHGERAKKYANYSDNIDSQVRMKFKLVNSKGIPIPNVVMRLQYGYTERNKYSNQYGECMIDDALIGDKIKVFVDLRGNNTESEFICQEDNELHEIVLNTNKVPFFVWIIPILALIVFLIYYASIGFKNSDKEEVDEQLTEPKKDSLIITKYAFFVKNAKTSQPIADTRIKLIYSDTVIERRTDTKGFAEFAAFVHNLPRKYEIQKLGYLPASADFKPDSLFTIMLSQNDSVDIDPAISVCGNEVQSKGAKITIKTFKMEIPKGRFTIWFNMFNVATKVDIYKGPIERISAANLIFSTKGYVKGISNPSVLFESPDSLITVSFESNAPKTTWVYKVYCAKVPLKKALVPVETPIENNP